jgi:hypothetical protein
MVLGAIGAGQAVGQTAGVIQFVAGDVKIVQAGSADRTARKGVAVNVGDTVLTANGALAQLKMGDGAIVVVQSESRLTVAEFRYAGVEDGTEKVHYRLEQGGFRAVTGAIGRTHKKNYLIETPIAHMGVRGTDHESYYFPANGLASGDSPKPGAYNKVNTGRTFIRTGAGEVDVEPNQVGFVASAADVPSILSTVPGFFNRSIAPRNAQRPADSSPKPVQMTQVDQDIMSADGRSLVRGRGKPITEGTGNGPLYGFSIKSGSGPGAATLGRSGNGMNLSEGGAKLVNTGGVIVAGANVDWGTWQGGNIIVNGQITSGGVNVIKTDLKTNLAAVGPTLMSANYSYIPSSGAAVLTNGAGNPGMINALDVAVDFTNQKITNYHLNATAVGTWDVNGSGSISAFTGGSGINLNGSCTNCAGGSMGVADGTAHGTFVGPNADGLITSFGMSSAGRSLTGAAYLKK